MSEKLTEVYTTAQPYQAHELKNLLAEAGIDAVVLDEACQDALGSASCCCRPAATRVVVSDQDADSARRIARDFQEQTQSVEPDEGAEAQPPKTETPRPSMAAWPLCPKCGRPRHTSCPVCGTAGNDFSQADPEFAGTLLDDDPAAMVLVCGTCDEPFVPRFLRRCEWCGHDFGEGEEPRESAAEELSGRTVFLMLGVAALLIAMIGYFMWLL
jgi:hypothetical protein